MPRDLSGPAGLPGIGRGASTHAGPHASIWAGLPVAYVAETWAHKSRFSVMHGPLGLWTSTRSPTMLGLSNNYPQQRKEGFMSGHKLEVLARESIDAFNRSDWEAILAMFAPGFIYEETGTGRRLEGAEATLSALQEWKSAFPDAVGDVTRVVVDGDTTVT